MLFGVVPRFCNKVLICRQLILESILGNLIFTLVRIISGILLIHLHEVLPLIFLILLPLFLVFYELAVFELSEVDGGAADRFLRAQLKVVFYFLTDLALDV